MILDREQLNKLAATLGGIPVWACHPGSPAARAGVRYGDVVLSVNGQRTRDLRDYVDARARNTEFMDLLVFRDGREHAFLLEFGQTRTSASAQD